MENSYDENHESRLRYQFPIPAPLRAHRKQDSSGPPLTLTKHASLKHPVFDPVIEPVTHARFPMAEKKAAIKRGSMPTQLDKVLACEKRRKQAHRAHSTFDWDTEAEKDRQEEEALFGDNFTENEDSGDYSGDASCGGDSSDEPLSKKKRNHVAEKKKSLRTWQKENIRHCRGASLSTKDARRNWTVANNKVWPKLKPVYMPFHAIKKGVLCYIADGSDVAGGVVTSIARPNNRFEVRMRWDVIPPHWGEDNWYQIDDPRFAVRIDTTAP